MREHYYKTPPPKMRDGLPMAPKWMLIGSELLSISDVRVVSVEHEGKGRIAVRLVGADATYERFGSPDRKPGDVPDPQSLGVEKGGVRFWLTATTAQEMVDAVSSRVQKEAFLTPAAAVEGDGTEVDLGQVASIDLAHIGATDTQYLFLRALDAPYSLRLELAPASATRFVIELRAVAAKMSVTERDAQIETICTPIEVGPRPEQGPVVPAMPEIQVRQVREPAKGLLLSLADRLLSRFRK
jgi:hypothetical protein